MEKMGKKNNKNVSLFKSKILEFCKYLKKIKKNLLKLHKYMKGECSLLYIFVVLFDYHFDKSLII